MAIIKSVRGYTPVIGENTFLADNATVIGDATIGRDCSIWFSAVVRGDVNTITIGDRVNIQDGAVIHTLYQRSVTEIGNDVSIGHNANIHGAKIEDKCLIGMGNGFGSCGGRYRFDCGCQCFGAEWYKNRTWKYLCWHSS